MFSIEMVASKNEIIESVHYRRFKIIINDFSEELLLPLDFWGVNDYISHWRKQLTQFLSDKQDKTYLITEMHNPNTANFIRWWIIYRENDSVFFQEQLVFMDDIVGVFSPDDAYSYIEERRVITEDGDEISEWEARVSDVTDTPLISDGEWEFRGQFT